MIDRFELLDSIRKCEKDPITYASCEKLAVFHFLLKQYFGDDAIKELRSDADAVSQSPKTNMTDYITVNGDSEFLQVVDGMNVKRFWKVIDELMLTLKVTDRGLYYDVLRKMEE